MALLLVHHAGASQSHPLPSCAIVGRAASCTVRIHDPTVPMHWLELRWSPRGWRWRTLSGETRTRGIGALLDDGWRLLPESTPARTQRLRLGDAVAVELVDGGPPERFLVDLQTGAALSGEAMEEVVEVREDILLPMSAEGDRGSALRDGDVLVCAGRAWRVHLAAAPEPTLLQRLDLSRSDASVEVLDDGLRAVFHQGGSEAVLTGEHVRTLHVYARARAGDTPRGGWLSVQAAWEAWAAAGGNPDSPLERLAWDRARCRTHLARQGVGGLEQLFEARRIGGLPHYRLGIRAE